MSGTIAVGTSDAKPAAAPLGREPRPVRSAGQRAARSS